MRHRQLAIARRIEPAQRPQRVQLHRHAHPRVAIGDKPR
jgi:hypothetical protein